MRLFRAVSLDRESQAGDKCPCVRISFAPPILQFLTCLRGQDVKRLEEFEQTAPDAGLKDDATGHR
jgi:hypothetical protein